MSVKLVARMIDRQADQNPSIHWKSPWIAVLGPSGELVPRYGSMCNVLDILTVDQLKEAIKQIEILEAGIEPEGSVGLNDRAALMTPQGVTFWFEHESTDGDETENCKVSLAQFKLAILTFVHFLSDPERKPIEIEFPER